MVRARKTFVLSHIHITWFTSFELQIFIGYEDPQRIIYARAWLKNLENLIGFYITRCLSLLVVLYLSDVSRCDYPSYVMSTFHLSKSIQYWNRKLGVVTTDVLVSIAPSIKKNI